MHEHGTTCTSCLDRRQMLTRVGTAGAVVAGVAVLAACGGGTDTPAATPNADGSLAKVADIPVGGSLSAVSGSDKILLVQATAGTVTAYSAICTHQGCTVSPGKKTLNCPCHGSVFDLTGAPVSGPAKKPLPPFDVHVENGAVFAGKA